MSILLKKLSVLFMLLVLVACGGGGWSMTDTDPAGTDTVSIAAAPASLQAGQSTIITATVNNGSGNVVQLREVSFAVRTNNSGGTLSVLNGETKSDGKAVATYTTGSNSPASDVEDTIQVNLSNGASAAVIITRSGKTQTTPVLSALTATPSTVSAGQSSIITANVTDNGSPISGVVVSFTIAVNNTGSPTLTAYSAVSDSNGNVTTIYTPGTASPTDTVTDTIQASLVNGSNRAIGITRSAGTIPTGATVVLTASPTTVNGGQASIITATVTGGPNGGANEAVSFTIPFNNSGAGFINASGVRVSSITISTGSSGTAVAIYQAGTTASGTSVQDTVQAVVVSSQAFNAVTITRSAGVTGYTVTVTANPSTLVSRTGVSLITANVRASNGTAVPNVSVSFTLVPAGGGGSVATPVTTDGSGNAITAYTSAHVAAGADIIMASVQIGGVTYTGASTITVP
jgi:hypothetical protein